MTAPVTGFQFLRTPAFKFFLIATLIVLLLVPLLLVALLVAEREGRAREVGAEVARVWGGPQTLSGPFLVVPYAVHVETLQGDKKIDQIVERRAVFLPEALDVVADSKSQVLHRSIFDVNVYTAGVTLEGRFPAPELNDVETGAVEVRWQDAILAIGLSDVAGLKEASNLEIKGDGPVAFEPSLGIPGATASGIHARLDEAKSLRPSPDVAPSAFSFRVALSFSGSSSLMFTPAARETRVAMKSDWPHPSFSGSFLPAERNVGSHGFTASWRVPHLARSVPSAWSLAETGIERLSPYEFGLSYVTPVDFYDLVTRAVKYAVLFLSATFMGVFVLEVTSGRHLHPVQYLLTGIAMIFFYVLLLSLAEHIGFAPAYLAAATATTAMLGAYVGRATQSTKSGIVMAGLLAAAYGVLYLILQLEDYALLAGALLGFAALTAIMFSTLRVDWSAATERRMAAGG